jgi:SAM-dependent methyltransferase
MFRFLLSATLALALWCQPAALPTDADMVAYRAFRAWMMAQPDRIERSAPDKPYPDELLAKFEARLRADGKSPSEIDAALAPLRKFGQKLEHEMWNRNLTAEQPRFNTEPNAFLVAMTKGRKPGNALDVGMGQGRNAIYLAKQGWDVTGFDPAGRALARAQELAAKDGVKIKTILATSESFDFGKAKWDLVLISYAGGRGLSGQILESLKPGGLVLIEGFHEDATKQGSIGSGVVFKTNELLTLFSAFRVLHYEDVFTKADFGPGNTRVVRLLAQKP